MKHFLLNSLVIGLIFLVSGCGLFQGVIKTSESDLLKMTAERSKDAVKTLTDRSVVLIKEKTDTIVVVPEQIIRQAQDFGMDSLVNGITAIKNDLVDVRLVLNPITQRLFAEAVLKPRKIPVRMEKEILIHKDIKEQSAKIENSKIQLKEEKIKTVKEREPFRISYLLGALLVAIVAVFFALKLGDIKFL